MIIKVIGNIKNSPAICGGVPFFSISANYLTTIIEEVELLRPLEPDASEPVIHTDRLLVPVIWKDTAVAPVDFRLPFTSDAFAAPMISNAPEPIV